MGGRSATGCAGGSFRGPKYNRLWLGPRVRGASGPGGRRASLVGSGETGEGAVKGRRGRPGGGGGAPPPRGGAAAPGGAGPGRARRSTTRRTLVSTAGASRPSTWAATASAV